jgi:uncharacterized HAD superfamily protein
MLFAIDIDATIATDRNGYARHLNTQLELGIAEDTIQQLESYADFHRLPAVQNFLQQSEQKARYWHVYEGLQHEPEIQKQLVPISGAVDALNNLAHSGKIVYVTCRQPAAELITSEWLARYKFPSPAQITICPHYHYKYLAAYEHSEPREKVILIDDHAKEMILSFFIMTKTHLDIAVSLCRRLAVIAFDQTEPPTFHFKVPFPIVALPSWHPDDLTRMQQAQKQYRAS